MALSSKISMFGEGERFGEGLAPLSASYSLKIKTAR